MDIPHSENNKNNIIKTNIIGDKHQIVKVHTSQFIIKCQLRPDYDDIERKIIWKKDGKIIISEVKKIGGNKPYRDKP